MKDALLQAHGFAVAAARRSFPAFLSYAGLDDEGRAFQRRELDEFTWVFAEECFEANTPCGIMLPFGSGKTTLACWRAAWELGRDPNLLCSVVTYSAERACELVELVRSVVGLDAYRRVFPHVKVIAGKDSADRFTVERTGLSNNPTCAGFGILTGTGTRTSLLILDDVVTLKNALLEPSNRRRVLDAIRTTWMSRQKMSAAAKRRTVWLQTAYHASDAAAVLREDPQSGWRWLVVRAEHPFEVLTWEKWERGACVEVGVIECPFPAAVLVERAQQMGPTAAARGLGNRPVSPADCPFKPEHFDGPEPLDCAQYRRRILFADPAGDATKLKTGDPDWCAVVAIGQHPTDRAWDVILADRMRGAPFAQAEFVARKANQVRAQVVYQEAIKDEALVEVTQRMLRGYARPVPVRPVKPTTNKEIRIIQTLEPALSTRPPLLRVCGAAFPELKNEALVFPAGSHDDLLDALAGAFAHAGAEGSLLTGGVGTASERRRHESWGWPHDDPDDGLRPVPPAPCDAPLPPW